MRKARTLALLLAFIFAALFPSPGFSQLVKVGRAGLISDAGIYIAFEKGYYKEQGIEIDFGPTMPAGEQMAMLGAGKLEVVTGGINPGLFNAIARGLPIVVVADKGSLPPGYGFMSLIVRKDLWDSGQVKRIKDLKGKIVATNAPSSPNVYLWARAMEKEGLTLADVNMKSIPFPLMATALGNKAIDAANPGEPFATKAVEMGVGVRMMTLDQVTPYMQIAAIFYNRDFATKSQELARRWMVAYLKGIRQYHDALREKGSKREEMLQVLMKHTGIKERDLYDKMVWAGLNPDGLLNKESILDQQKFFVEIGQVPKPAPLEKIVDDSFVNHALQVLGKYGPR